MDWQIHRWVLKKLSLARCTPGSNNKQPHNDPKKRRARLPAIYEESALSEKIPIKFLNRIQDPRYLKHIVYESYKPQNLREMQDYLHFILHFRKIVANVGDGAIGPGVGRGVEERMRESVEELLERTGVSQELKDYYNSEVDTQLPPQLGKWEG